MDTSSGMFSGVSHSIDRCPAGASWRYARRVTIAYKVKTGLALDVDVTGRVNAEIPIRENLNIPLTQTLTPRVYFDNQVPIKTTIPVRETLKIN